MARKVGSELRRWLGILSLSSTSLGLMILLKACGGSGSPVAVVSCCAF